MRLCSAVALALVLGVGCTSRPTAPLQTAVIPHGPFEIVAEGRRIGTGGFPNNAGSPFDTMEVTGFRVRWRGQPVTIAHGDRSLAGFWRVVRLPDAPQPTLLASTTDFHLVTEQDGRLETRSFGEPSTDLAEYQWLDADQGQPSEPQMFGIEKVDLTSGTEIRGGRWLRLSHHTVLDVQTLRVFPVRPWIESGTGKPMAGLGGGSRAVVFSPGRTQYVTVGSGYDYERDGEHYEALLIVDVPSGDAYGLRVERERTHYFETSDVTAAWLAHYYRWTRDGHGERLEPRPDAKPLPWLGRLRDTGSREAQYDLRPVRPEMQAVLTRFLTTTMGAVVTADWIDPTRTDGSTFKVPGCPGVIALYWSDGDLGLFAPTSRGQPPADCGDTVRQIARTFDAELARGAHQELFDYRPVAP